MEPNAREDVVKEGLVEWIGERLYSAMQRALCRGWLGFLLRMRMRYNCPGGGGWLDDIQHLWTASLHRYTGVGCNLPFP